MGNLFFYFKSKSNPPIILIFFKIADGSFKWNINVAIIVNTINPIMEIKLNKLSTPL